MKIRKTIVRQKSLRAKTRLKAKPPTFAMMKRPPELALFEGHDGAACHIRPTGQGEWHASIGYENKRGKNSASFTTSVGP